MNKSTKPYGLCIGATWNNVELASDLRSNYHEISYQNPLTFPSQL
jgi:hypothetical protein